jgi:hypothetical protein
VFDTSDFVQLKDTALAATIDDFAALYRPSGWQSDPKKHVDCLRIFCKALAGLPQPELSARSTFDLSFAV